MFSYRTQKSGTPFRYAVRLGLRYQMEVAVMVVICGFLYRWFRKSGWL